MDFLPRIVFTLIHGLGLHKTEGRAEEGCSICLNARATSTIESNSLMHWMPIAYLEMTVRFYAVIANVSQILLLPVRSRCPSRSSI